MSFKVEQKTKYAIERSENNDIVNDLYLQSTLSQYSRSIHDRMCGKEVDKFI